MGPLHYFLGIQVLRQPTSLVLSQQKYLEDLLRETNMLTSKPCATPMPTAPTLSKAMGSPHPHPEHYRQVLGSLQYLTLTRPDIAFSVNKMPRRISSSRGRGRGRHDTMSQPMQSLRDEQDEDQSIGHDHYSCQWILKFHLLHYS
ncbi:hypothetical protein GH714_026587 [Hevea brasiliensis]|uniref:Reverse transcriptase Ty1/copia-type domain-containing protein n=1 Tax=Hevea brasiliensis TaxID=3981 RepID=A0A6A6NKF8_HEVBR|nr:hypothetical protein GH714_026587 [Hevea brasiliensis]